MAVPIWNENSKSYLVNAKTDVKDRIDVVVGDDQDPNNFQPQMKMMRWDNEANVSFRLVHDNIPGLVQSENEENGVITWTKKHGQNEWIARFYEDWGTPEGAYKFVELVMPVKPPTNQISFTVVSKDVQFTYQPPLTQEDIDNGANRPDEVVGSYAIYSTTKGRINDADGKDYKVGKVGHLYRAKLIDNNGDEIWADYNTDLNETGVLTITVDQTWLDNAAYPVTLDPNFGYETEGGSTHSASDDSIIRTNLSYAGGNGTGDSMSVYCRAYGSGHYIAMGLYDASDDTLVDNTGGVATQLSAQWHSADFSGSPSLSSGTNYYLCFNHDDNVLTYIYYDTFGSGRKWYSVSYGTWPDPVPSWSTFGSPTPEYSIYATYTASASDVDASTADTSTLSDSITSKAGSGAGEVQDTSTTSDAVSARSGNATANVSDTSTVGDDVTVTTTDIPGEPLSVSISGWKDSPVRII